MSEYVTCGNRKEINNAGIAGMNKMMSRQLTYLSTGCIKIKRWTLIVKKEKYI